MGFLRTAFALSVAIMHAGLIFGINIVDGNLAVSSFYMISGFYMALILNEKYVKNNSSAWLFVSNRFLRIYPIYYLTLFVTLVFILIKYFFHIGTPDNLIEHYLTQTQFTISQSIEIINYILRNLTLIITLDYFVPTDSTGGYLIIQQAQTLQMELLFYLLSPLLLRRSDRSLLSIAAIYIFGYFFILLPLGVIPEKTLTSMFLTIFIYFLLGIVAYRFLYAYVQKRNIPKHVLVCIFIGFVAYAFFHQFTTFRIPLHILQIQDALYFFILTVSLPFIFILSAKNKIDKEIGQLSYPIYITHFFFIKLMNNIPVVKDNQTIVVIISITLTLLASYVLAKYFEAPLDKFRQKRLAKVHM